MTLRRNKTKPHPRGSSLLLLTVRTGFSWLSRWLPKLAGRIACTLFFRPRRSGTPRPEKAVWQAGSTQHLSFEGDRLELRTWGQGPTVLLLHGWEGRGSQFVDFIKPLTRAGFQVAILDLPAHGSSRRKSTNLPQMARAITEVAAGLQPLAGIVAHSLGATAATLALHEGLQARNMISIASPFWASQVLNTYAGMLNLNETAGNYLRLFVEKKIKRPMDSIMGPSVVQRLETPALIVHDQEDPLIHVETANLLTETWPGAKCLITSGLGHHRILRDPMVVAQSLEFLQTSRKQPVEKEAVACLNGV